MSCKKSRALCHCSPVRNLVGLAGFAMNFPKEMDGFCCCILPPLQRDENGCILSFAFLKMCFDKPDINAILNPLFLQNNSLDKSNIDSNSTLITPTQPFFKVSTFK